MSGEEPEDAPRAMATAISDGRWNRSSFSCAVSSCTDSTSTTRLTELILQTKHP